MTSELRPAVAVWIDAEEAYARSHKPDPKGGRYTFADPFAPAAVIEADREAVRAEQAAELAKFKALAETLAGALELADCALSGANMNMKVVYRKVAAALLQYKEARDVAD